MNAKVLEQIHSAPLKESEQVLACCIIAREKLEVGDYDAGCSVLRAWWKVGESPNHQGLTQRSAAELLLTAGVLTDSVARAKQVLGGQRLAEVLLSGAIALFDHLGETTKAVEARIELGCCYYHQGLFDLAHITLSSCVITLTDQDSELKAVALIRLAIVERHSGRLHEALSRLNEAALLENLVSPWTKGRFQTEMANTLKDLGVAESRTACLDRALGHYREASLQFEQVGNLRYLAAVENNRGYLLLTLNRFEEAQLHLQRARNLFSEFGDSVGCAQVDETLAQLHLASENYEAAERSIKLAVNTLEESGEEALLAEALNTQGLILCRLEHRHEAKPILERARRVAERCGDREGAGRALLIMIEEMCENLDNDERREIGAQANQLLANSQQHATRERLGRCLELISEAHTKFEAQREQKIHAEKMAALGELSFGVAHNVNNTLTGILGRAQLLLRSTDSKKIVQGLELIIKSAEDGAQIIRRIQDFARKRPSREFEPISIAELLKDAAEMSRPRCEARPDAAPVRLVLSTDCKAFVKGDEVELREVLVNMIYNAVDAMPAGGEICLGTEETRDRVVITIADTGMGMGPEVKSRLFDPFFSTKGKLGTGMGLAVSFGIVRRHDGSIEVDSEPDRGTTFKISLPKVARMQTRDAQTSSPDSNSSNGEKKIRVLVVDDETPVRDVLIEALEAEGCEVLAANSGEVALELYDKLQGEFDAVFTDIGMPEMSGWELVTAIRERSKTVLLAIVSGWADAISHQTRSAVNANWVVAKPFDLDRIVAIAQEIAQRKSASTK
jgi:signal transduction histidine kinase/ActR/RegA family two-component response regulator/predicted negative regulator of RcsB-dependent stress response